MPSVTYFLRNKAVATIPDLKAPCALSSIAYCCTTCGEVWARIVVTGADSVIWTFEPAPCEAHEVRGVPDWGKLPGSLLPRAYNRRTDIPAMWWARALEHLPSTLLEREFWLALGAFDKEQQNV